MKLMVNNQNIELQAAPTLAGVIAQFGASGQYAVALNGQFVSKQHYQQTPVTVNDKVEILSPLEGG